MSNKQLNEVAPAVFRLGNELFNWYLIKDGRSFTLIDGGLPGYWSQLQETLKQLNGTIADIKAVLLTHAHLDHVGLVERVRRESDAAVYLHPADEAMGKRGGAQIPPVGLIVNAWRKQPFRILTSAVRHNVFFGKGIQSYTPLSGGETVDVPGRPQVIFTPGHTAGSISFWLPERQTLFAGDALVTIDMLSGRDPFPQLTPLNVGTNRAQSLTSLSYYEELSHVTLLTGHGNPWSGSMDDAIAQARQKAHLRN